MSELLQSRRRLPVFRRAMMTLAHALDVLLIWQQRHRERRSLAMLGEHMLKDIGVSRADIEVEMSKKFWRR